MALVGFLVVLAYALVLFLLDRQESDSRMINLAGRQRMLSQVLTKEALLLVQSESLEEKEKHRLQLNETLATWSKVHHGLQRGDAELRLPGDNSKAVLVLFAEIEPFYRILESSVEEILSFNPKELIRISFESVLIQDIVNASLPFLNRMDRVVFQYDREAQGRVNQIETLQTYILVALLLLLISEAIFIFRPIVKRIDIMHDSLRNANEQLRRDIEKRKRIEAERERLAQIKDEFIAIASHDIRNPLSQIMGISSLAENIIQPGFVMTEQAHQLMLNVFRHSKTMKRIVEDFFDFNALKDGKIEIDTAPNNINDIVIKATANQTEYMKRKKIHLTLKSDPQLPLADVDEARIEQVVQNYIDNAIKFSPPGSKVVVRLRANNQSVMLEVADNGPGLTRHDMKKVFGRYERLSAKPTGGEKSFGLGLAICKDLIEHHGGEVGVRNNPAGGATFWFRLPAIQTAASKPKRNGNRKTEES